MSLESIILAIIALTSLAAVGSVSFLFWEVYKAASELVSKIDDIFDEINDMDACSKKDVEEVIKKTSENTRP